MLYRYTSIDSFVNLGLGQDNAFEPDALREVAVPLLAIMNYVL